jgi:hypothetical protein
MVDTYLVPENTTVVSRGDGQVLDLSAAKQRVFLVTLRITEIVEQEAIDVAILGATDAATWDPKPLLSFPQKFYRGESPMLLDIVSRSDVKFLKAHWDVHRWGRGPEEPRFVFDVRIREVPAEMLAEARKEAKS